MRLSRREKRLNIEIFKGFDELDAKMKIQAIEYLDCNIDCPEITCVEDCADHIEMMKQAMWTLYVSDN